VKWLQLAGYKRGCCEADFGMLPAREPQCHTLYPCTIHTPQRRNPYAVPSAASSSQCGNLPPWQLVNPPHSLRLRRCSTHLMRTRSPGLQTIVVLPGWHCLDSYRARGSATGCQCPLPGVASYDKLGAGPISWCSCMWAAARLHWLRATHRALRAAQIAEQPPAGEHHTNSTCCRTQVHHRQT
jgi:hypothetical protein